MVCKSKLITCLFELTGAKIKKKTIWYKTTYLFLHWSVLCTISTHFSHLSIPSGISVPNLHTETSWQLPAISHHFTQKTGIGLARVCAFRKQFAQFYIRKFKSMFKTHTRRLVKAKGAIYFMELAIRDFEVEIAALLPIAIVRFFVEPGDGVQGNIWKFFRNKSRCDYFFSSNLACPRFRSDRIPFYQIQLVISVW